MIQPNQSASRGAGRSRRTGRVLLGVLVAGALGACVHDQPVGPERAAADAPSLVLNPACLGPGGQTHTDSVTAPATWNPLGNPHRVQGIIHIQGAGVLTIMPGTLVCFGTGGALYASSGGSLVANGLSGSPILLTAMDPDSGWWGVHMGGTPASGSSLRNVRLEYTRTVYSLSTNDSHGATLDSVAFRQVEHGLHLWGQGTSIRRSRLDTITSALVPAVALGNQVTFEKNTIRGAAGVGLAVLGTSGVSLLGGRIEGSGGVGMQATAIAGPGFTATQPVRVVGAGSYPAELSVGAFSKIYTQTSHQDSLLGNARDTLVITGGALTWLGIASSKIPWRVTGNITVTGWGGLNALPGARLVFDSAVSITAINGGRVVARGSAAAPAVFTSVAPAGWGGIVLDGAPSLASALTNVRIENAKDSYAVLSHWDHTVIIDSAVFRQNGSAAYLRGTNSRLSRSRIDTTLIGSPAVIIEANGGVVESTLIRGSQGSGLSVGVYWNIEVRSCEIRESGGDGIELLGPIAVHNCNLVNNAGWGIDNWTAYLVDVEDNWWGDASGPTGPNGDGVSGPLDYTPWRTTPYVLPYVP